MGIPSIKPTKAVLGLIPLKNFGVVSKKYHIYRCGQPMYSRDYSWCAEVLKLQTIVNLRAESHHDHLHAEKYGITVYDIPIVDNTPPTLEQADEFVTFIRNTAALSGQHPVLIHCEHGHGRTTTFCVLAKLALDSTLKKALKEETKKFHYAFSHFIQERFLEEYYERMLAKKPKPSKAAIKVSSGACQMS